MRLQRSAAAIGFAVIYCVCVMSKSDNHNGDTFVNGPLEGIRVLEFGNFVAGPWAGSLLADMGADVIKIEPPWGDPWRQSMPFLPGETRLFITVNRGTRSVRLDLKDPKGRSALAKIVKTADAALSNNRPDTAEKLGINYESLSQMNPDLVYVDITAYGRKGPRAGMPGFDLIMQGFTGAVATEGKVSQDGQPDVVWSSSYIDLATGYAAALGVVAGVLCKRNGGAGQNVETSLMANAIAMQSQRLTHMYDMPSATMEWYENRYGELKEEGASYAELLADYQKSVRPTAQRSYYRAYRTKDGGLCLGTLDIRARARLLDYLGMDDPRVTDPDYVDAGEEADRFAEEMIVKLESIFMTKTTDEWFSELRAEEVDVPCEPIRFSEEVVFDEQADANGYMRDYEHHTGHRYRASGSILQFASGMPEAKSSPALGADTSDVLREAGLTEEEIAELVG